MTNPYVHQEPTGGAEFNPDFDGGEECLGIDSATGMAKDSGMLAMLTSKSLGELPEVPASHSHR